MVEVEFKAPEKFEVPEIVKPLVPVINPLEFNVVVVVACNADVPAEIVKPLDPVINPVIVVGFNKLMSLFCIVIV